MTISITDDIARDGALPVEEVLMIVLDVGETIDRMHKQGKIFGRLSGDLLLFSSKRRLILGEKGLDPGRLRDTKYLDTLSPVELCSIPPEVWKDQEWGMRSDVYALGALMFQMLTGHTTFSGESAQDIINKICSQPAPSVLDHKPNISRRVADLVSAMTSPVKERRPHNMMEVLGIVDELASPSDTLVESIAKHGPFPERDAAMLSLCLANTLGELHAREEVYGRLNSKAVLLAPSGMVALSVLTINPARIGDSMYCETLDEHEVNAIAPEVWEHQSWSVKSDLFALGVVIFTLFTGEVPFAGSNYYEIISAQRQNSSKNPSELNKRIPQWLSDLLLLLLSNDPAKRISSAKDVAISLRDGFSDFRRARSRSSIRYIDPTMKSGVFADSGRRAGVLTLKQIFERAYERSGVADLVESPSVSGVFDRAKLLTGVALGRSNSSVSLESSVESAAGAGIKPTLSVTNYRRENTSLQAESYTKLNFLLSATVMALVVVIATFWWGPSFSQWYFGTSQENIFLCGLPVGVPFVLLIALAPVVIGSFGRDVQILTRSWLGMSTILVVLWVVIYTTNFYTLPYFGNGAPVTLVHPVAWSITTTSLLQFFHVVLFSPYFPLQSFTAQPLVSLTVNTNSLTGFMSLHTICVLIYAVSFSYFSNLGRDKYSAFSIPSLVLLGLVVTEIIIGLIIQSLGMLSFSSVIGTVGAELGGGAYSRIGLFLGSCNLIVVLVLTSINLLLIYGQSAQRSKMDYSVKSRNPTSSKL